MGIICGSKTGGIQGGKTCVSLNSTIPSLPQEKRPGRFVSK